METTTKIIIFASVILAIFYVVGIYCIVSFLRVRRMMKDAPRDDRIKIAAGKVIDYKMETHTSGLGTNRRHTTLFYPIYEYFSDGERKTYTSTSGTSIRGKLGKETTLYIDEHGNVDVPEENNVTLIMGIAFIIISSMILFILVNAATTQPKSNENDMIENVETK